MRVLTLTGLLALAACREPPAPGVAPRAPRAAASVAVASVPTPDAAAPPAAPPRPDPCPPLPAGKTSDDETPSIRGVGAPTPALAWFEARGVGRDIATRWWTARFAGNDVEYAECPVLKVGDGAEDALVCRTTSLTGFTRQRALTIVVRKKTPVVVLDVATGLGAMDWPDARHLDLALAFGPDGKAAELQDRAPDGVILVEPPSSCRAREKLLDACEKALKEGGTTDPMCPILAKPDGTKTVLRTPGSNLGSMAYPATLHDCTGAKKNMAELIKGNGAAFAAEARGAAAFIDKACRQRGPYVWKDGRFVL